MVRKVGISIDEKLHSRAKIYAKNTGRTLSGLVGLALIEIMETGPSHTVRGESSG